ncbi:MAG: MFS transporter, partial [Gammaproteobacteria bacterium]|nr:MFS transporter [Gammaproteobacteria bacterium]
NGLWSIARGALPLALFGARDYPVIMGRLATPMLIAAAAAPMSGSILFEWFGSYGTLLVLTLFAAIPCVAAIILWLDLTKHQDQLSFK